MNRFVFVLISFALLGAAAPKELPRATPAEEGISAEKLGAVKTIVQGAIDKHECPGAVVLTARNGKIVQLESLGKMDIESNKPMRPDALFRIYSMTKPITSVAALQLVEEGKIKLDEPVSTYLPELKNLRVIGAKPDETTPAKREMTVRDLMRHTSGLTYGAFGSSPVDAMYQAKNVQDRDATLAEMVTRLSTIPLLYEPGTRFNYSVSTDVLGRVIEVTSGQTLDQFLQQRVLQPLDMRDTAFQVPDDKLDRFTTCYQPDGKGGLSVQEAVATSPFRKHPKCLSGGGGLISTARDYLRFSQMLLNGGELDGVRILKPETVALMTTNQLPPEALPFSIGTFQIPGHGFGLGLMVQMNAEPAISAGSCSWSGFASTHFVVAPKPKVIVIVLQQVLPINPKLQMEVTPAIFGGLRRDHGKLTFAMTAAQIVKELKGLGSDSIRRIFANHGIPEPCLGVKVEELKKFQKKIKKDYQLALDLYDTGIYDAMYLAGLIADETKMTQKDLKRWADRANSDAIATSAVAWVSAESAHGRELALEWIESKSERTATIGWATLGCLVAVTEDADLDIAELKRLLGRVQKTIHKAPNRVRYCMNSFVIAVGSYVQELTELALDVGEKIGAVSVDMGKTSCQVPFAPDYIQKVQKRGTIGKKRKTVRC